MRRPQGASQPTENFTPRPLQERLPGGTGGGFGHGIPGRAATRPVSARRAGGIQTEGGGGWCCSRTGKREEGEREKMRWWETRATALEEVVAHADR